MLITKERYKKKSQIKMHKGFPKHLKMSSRKVILRTRRWRQRKGDGDQETREGQKEKENVVKHNEIGKDKKEIKKQKRASDKNREKKEIQENGSRKRDRKKEITKQNEWCRKTDAKGEGKEWDEWTRGRKR